MKILSIVGARPQFIKSAPVSKALSTAGLDEYILHTGQHYDHVMSQIFFDELGIRQPNINLDVGSGSHGWQTGEMLKRIENVIQQQNPDIALVYGDTNSTLAGALAAVKLHIPIAHVEAGLRSFNRAMPEEYNRVLTDHCSDILFCPTQTAVDNLAREGITRGVHLVGDTMYDAVLQFAEIARQRSTIIQDLELESKGFLLATVHRPYNTDDPENLRNILIALTETDETVVLPAHPRTRECLKNLGLVSSMAQDSKLILIDPVGYLDMLMLEQNARMILTDSGGIQKEAYFFGIPCVTLRPETEWVETVNVRWNMVAGADPEKIVSYVQNRWWPSGKSEQIFGDGTSARKIVRCLDSGSL